MEQEGSRGKIVTESQFIPGAAQSFTASYAGSRMNLKDQEGLYSCLSAWFRKQDTAGDCGEQRQLSVRELNVL